jgi:hypothetical protein
MKKIKLKISALFLATGVLISSCGTLVEPNYGGVLMQNYGKNGKSDFTEVSGRVSTWGMGTELYQVPMWEQRGQVDDTLHLISADNNEIEAYPKYSYQVTKGRLVDIVFDNRQLGRGKDFLVSVESNSLEPRIYDIIKEESRKYITDTLMSIGGALKFEKDCEALVRKAFEEKGLKLLTFVAQLKYSDKVREKIDQRLEVNTNVSVLDQQIIEQKKKNELEELRTQFILIQNKALTPEYLEKMKIEKWDGHFPTYYSGNGLPMINFANGKK